MSNQTTIQCPKCGTQIDVNEILYHQLEAQMKSKFDGEVDEHRKKYKAAMEEFKAKEDAFKDQQEKFDEQLRESVSTQLKAERQKLSDTLKKQILDEQSGQMELLQKEIAEKSEQVKELNRSKAEIEQLKHGKVEMPEQVEAELQKRLNESIKTEREKTEKRLREQLTIEQNDQLGIERVVYIDPYPGIAQDQILRSAQFPPIIRLLKGAIGTAYHKLYEPIISYKDEIEALENHA